MIEPGGYIKDIFGGAVGQSVTAHGWVKTRRDQKGVSFAQINDGSCFADLQVVIDAGVIPDDVLKDVTTGACVRVEGELVASPAAGQAVELKAKEIEVFGIADPATYPLQKKGHTMEFLRDIAHLRTRSNTFGAVFRVRNALAWAIHSFFQERGFLYVQTPIITASDAEGAGAMFGVTTLDLLNVPRKKGIAADGAQTARSEAASELASANAAANAAPNGSNAAEADKKKQLPPVDYEQDFFGKPAFLTVSGQLEAEIFALSFSNAYTFGPTFRAENSNTPRHLAEFWMIEPEMAFCDLQGNMRLAESFLKSVIGKVMDTCMPDLEFFNKRIDNTVLETLSHVVNSDFEHVTYTEAIAILERARNGGHAFEFPIFWGADLQSEHERYLTEQTFKKPVIVTDYPKEIKAFYMRANDDDKTVRAMDVLAPRIGEIIGGSQREERYDVLLNKIRAQNLSEAAYWWYLELRKYGSAPHAGFGLGFERLMLYLTGMKNIRDVIPFPRTPGSADF